MLHRDERNLNHNLSHCLPTSYTVSGPQFSFIFLHQVKRYLIIFQPDAFSSPPGIPKRYHIVPLVNTRTVYTLVRRDSKTCLEERFRCFPPAHHLHPLQLQRLLYDTSYTITSAHGCCC